MRKFLNGLLKSPEEKASRTARLLAFDGGGRARWTPRDYAALSREGYIQNAIVHRAVKMIAENVGSLTYVLYEGEAERDVHPLLALLRKPNPRQDGASFLESVTAHLLLAGNAYVEAVSVDGSPRELHALRPDRMRVVPGADGWPEAYEYQLGGRVTHFAQEGALPPILHLTQFHPLDDHYGLSPLEAAAIAIDALVMLAVLDRDQVSPPSTPEEGDRYLVSAPGAGAFAGKAGQIAHFADGAWTFHAPRAGWTCYVQDEGQLLAYDGADWESAIDVLGGVSELQELTRLGLGTSADGTNPFSAKLNNALWTAKTVADGGDGDLRYKLNKESASDTLSVLFQSGYGGRAEIGLIGDDDFRFKVSADGTAWHEAFSLDRADGRATFHDFVAAQTVSLSGDISPATISSDQNDYTPSGLAAASVLRLSSDATRNITGLAGGSDGRVVTLINIGTNTLTLKNANTSSTGANRFSFSADVTLLTKQSAVLWYDATDSRWRLISGPQSAGSGSAPQDLDIMLAELSLGLADALNVAQFAGSSGNRFADSFDALTYVDTGGATNLDSATGGLLKPSATAGSNQVPTMTSGTTSGVTVSDSSHFSGFDAYKAFDSGSPNNADNSDYYSAGTVSSGAPVYVTVDFGSGNDKVITNYDLVASAYSSYSNNAPKDWVLQGSTDNFSSSIIDLDTRSGVAAWTSGLSRNYAFSNATAYRYYRWKFTLSQSGGQLAFGKGALNTTGSINNLSVRSTSLTAAAAPTTMRCVARVKFVDSATLGTDVFFDVSRDGGTTWSTFTMSDRFTVNTLHVLESASLDITGQPSGTSVKWRIRTANAKMVEFHDIYIYWQ